MDFGLEGKTALIAGASSGIGFAVASELAAEGAHVAICGRDEQKLDEAARRIEDLGDGRVAATALDLTDPDQVEAWVADTVETFGDLDIAVINGGGPPFGSAVDFSLAEYRQAFEKVTFPVIGLALAVVPHVQKSGQGRLLFVTSETVATPVSKLCLSGATRAGLQRFAQSLAVELAPFGVTVNVLAPGLTRTPALEGAAGRIAGGDVEQGLALMGEDNLFGRPARPDEFAAVAAFLASARASFVTGTTQMVTGGADLAAHQPAYLRDAGKNTYG